MSNYLHTIINRKRATQKPHVRKGTLIRFLHENGYKPINTLPNLFLNDSGHIFDLSTYRKLSEKESRDILTNQRPKTKKAKPQRKQQPPIKRRGFAKILHEKGYKRIPGMVDLFINETAHVVNLITGKEIKPTKKNEIIYLGRYLRLEKLVLLTFRKVPYNKEGRIAHIDGNKLNLSPQNLEYITKHHARNCIDNERLKTAIRCYFEVNKRYTVRDYMQTRLYLKLIIKHRLFYAEFSQLPGMDIFKSYMHELTNSRARIAIKYGIRVRECDYIINNFINLLVNDILYDLQTGKLKVLEYIVNKTKTQEIRELNKLFIEMGMKPLPLRKLSNKERARKAIKKWKELMKKIDNLINEYEKKGFD